MGWLDQYKDRGEINYNDSSVSLPKGFVGEGYYSPQWKAPSWGGQFKDGGELTPIEKDNNKKRTIKIFAESPTDTRNKYDLNTYTLPQELEKIRQEYRSLEKGLYINTPSDVEDRLTKYLEGYYLSYNKPSTRYEGDPYSKGFRAGTQQEPYYDDPRNSMNAVEKLIYSNRYSSLSAEQKQKHIDSIEPSLNILNKLKELEASKKAHDNYYEKIDEVQEKFYKHPLNPITTDIIPTFKDEANNLKNVYKNNPNVNVDIIPIYGDADTTLIKNNLKGLTEEDALIIAGHLGHTFGGINNKWWNKNIKDSPACKYLGACYADEVVKDDFKDVKDLKYRNDTSWLGINPKSENLIDAMYSRNKDTVVKPVEGRDFKISNKTKPYSGFENGGELQKIDQLSNFTNYNKPQPGGWLQKYSK